MVLHRVRLMLMRQRVQISNAIRGHIAEFGLAAPIGREGLGTLIRLIAEGDEISRVGRSGVTRVSVRTEDGRPIAEFTGYSRTIGGAVVEI